MAHSAEGVCVAERAQRLNKAAKRNAPELCFWPKRFHDVDLKAPRRAVGLSPSDSTQRAALISQQHHRSARVLHLFVCSEVVRPLRTATQSNLSQPRVHAQPLGACARGFCTHVVFGRGSNERLTRRLCAGGAADVRGPLQWVQGVH